MKAKEARLLLEGFSGDYLYQKARKIFEEETDSRIALRSHGASPSRGTIESVLEEMKVWFRKASENLPWTSSDLLEKTIEWETGQTWVRHNILDPRITALQKKTRLNILRRTPFPMAEALDRDSLEAVGSMMLARMTQMGKAMGEVLDKRRSLAEEKSLKICWFDKEATECPNQETFSLAESLPADVSQLAFLCNLRDKECSRFKGGDS